MENPTKQRKFNVRRLHKLQRSEGGSNQHCCVPLCSASSRYNGSLSFHRFPKKTILRAQWIQKIRRTGFEVTNHTKMCSRHFDNKLITSTGKGLRVLLPNSVPSLFNWNNFIARQTRAGVWERRERPASPEPCSDPEEPELPVPMVLDHEYSAVSPTFQKGGALGRRFNMPNRPTYKEHYTSLSLFCHFCSQREKEIHNFYM